MAYQAAKYFRYAGRVLVVVGVSIDVVSIARANKPMRRATEVVAGWASAWIGCKTVGTGGAALGSLASPIGSAVGGVGACIIGGAAAYYGGATLAGRVYDWAEDTIFVTIIPETLRP